MTDIPAKVMIGVDDSPESRHAVEIAHDFFGDTSDYTIVSIGRRSPLFSATYPMGSFAGQGDLAILFDADERRAESAATAAAALIPCPDVHTEVHLGQPGRSLCELATDHGSDVIVIGSHDKNAWDRLFNPSVGRYLIDHATCPVLVVR